MVEVSKDGKMSGTPDMHFLAACRDFYDVGEDGFSPKYAHYGDLLETAERVVATLQAERDRYREALEYIAADPRRAPGPANFARTALSDTPTVQS